ncbi:MAG: DNA adenine methylase [Planctomycetia bacterium]|nr:DNA adenine methylase [Planctomycetia bacterium]
MNVFDDIQWSHGGARRLQTQGVKYAGSKRPLLPQILDLVRETGARSVWDAFSGATHVAQALAQQGQRVIASDISFLSQVFATCYLKSKRPIDEIRQMIEELNALPPEDGWFSEHYGGEVRENSPLSLQKDGLKKPFQKKNTQKLDAIRRTIDGWELDEETRCVLLVSLILALNEVDNTLGHFTSYLREWSPRSYRTLELRVPQLFPHGGGHEVYRADVFDLAEGIRADFAYFDPPYGSNNEKMPSSRVRYAAYYHFWTTVILNDRPALFGKAARRMDSSDLLAHSPFEEFRKNASGRFVAVEAIQRLLKITPVEWILLSYSSGGRATAEELLDVIHEAGKLVKMLKIDYRQNVMARMTWTSQWLRELETKNQEFLFLIQK